MTPSAIFSLLERRIDARCGGNQPSTRIDTHSDKVARSFSQGSSTFALSRSFLPSLSCPARFLSLSLPHGLSILPRSCLPEGRPDDARGTTAKRPRVGRGEIFPLLHSTLQRPAGCPLFKRTRVCERRRRPLFSSPRLRHPEEETHGEDATCSKSFYRGDYTAHGDEATPLFTRCRYHAPRLRFAPSHAWSSLVSEAPVVFLTFQRRSPLRAPPSDELDRIRPRTGQINPRERFVRFAILQSDRRCDSDDISGICFNFRESLSCPPLPLANGIDHIRPVKGIYINPRERLAGSRWRNKHRGDYSWSGQMWRAKFSFAKVRDNTNAVISGGFDRDEYYSRPAEDVFA